MNDLVERKYLFYEVILIQRDVERALKSEGSNRAFAKLQKLFYVSHNGIKDGRKIKQIITKGYSREKDV